LTTSNIHIGLAAWQTAHSYSIGTRVSSGSNAYQAISTGTSGGTAPSGTTSSISDGAVNWKYLSGIDYTSLMAWGNAIPSTLSSNIIGQLWNDGTITTTDQVPFLTLGVGGAQRNTGIYTITLTCAAGESFRDKLKGSNTPLTANTANGVCFQLPSAGNGGINYFDIYDTPVTFDGLQFIDPYSTSNSTILNVNSSTVFTLSHSIFDGYAQDNGAAIINSSQSLHMSNCLVVDRQATGVNGVAVHSGDGDASSTIVNNTFIRINPTNGTETLVGGYLVNGAATVVRNNIFFGYTNPVGGNTYSALVDHCATDATSVGFATDSGNNLFSLSIANQFISATSDFHLKTGSACLNAGITDTTDIPLSNDIIGYARPQGTAWAIGAAEFTGQISANITIGALRISANIATVNNATLAKSIGSITTISSAKQIDNLAATVSIGAISLISSSLQTDNATLVKSIGTISIISTIQNTNSASATISLNLTSIGLVSSFVTAVGLTTIAPITPIAAAIGVNALSGINTIGPITPITTTAGQFDLAAGTFSLILLSGGLISQTVINTSALLSLSIIPLVSLLQIDNAHATIGIGAIASVSAFGQNDLTSATLSIGTVGSNIAMRQEDNQSAISTIAVSCMAAISQFDLASALRSIGSITLLGSANLTYIITATPAISAISCVVNAGQSDLLSLTVRIGAVSAVASFANPVPAVGLATIGLVSSVAAFGFENVASGDISIGAITCIASSNLLLAGSASFVVSCVATASNPYPLTAAVSVASISCIGVATNLTPIPATATISMPALSSLIQAGQIDFSSALISLVVTSRITITNAPILRISQLPIEALTRGGALHVSQTAIEVASRGGALRVSQTAIEVLTQSALPSAGRVSQIVGEVLASGTPRALASQVIQEILTGGSAIQNVRMSQVVTEILTGGSTTQNVLMTQVVLETLISAVPLNIISTTYIAV
jgi:hypothetical protein